MYAKLSTILFTGVPSSIRFLALKSTSIYLLINFDALMLVGQSIVLILLVLDILVKPGTIVLSIEKKQLRLSENVLQSCRKCDSVSIQKLSQNLQNL